MSREDCVRAYISANQLARAVRLRIRAAEVRSCPGLQSSTSRRSETDLKLSRGGLEPTMLTRRTLLAGLIASLVMGMFQMLYEAVAGAGFWSPPTLIAATLVRDLQANAIPVVFQPVAVVLGLIGHMMNSVVLGIVFGALIAPRVEGRNAVVMAGAIYGLGVFMVMRLAVVPLLDPAFERLSAPAFAVAHLMWGAIIGLVLSWNTGREVALAQAHV
jgi:uncharacterized membrane protein YagU involved in acid resistance